MTIFINARFLTQKLSGVQRYAFEISMQLKKSQHEIVFLSPKNIIQSEWSKELNPLIIGNFTAYLWEQIDLPLFLKSKKSPVLLNFCNTAPVFYNNNFITIHDLAYKQFPKSMSFISRNLYRILIPVLIKKSKHIFTVSDTIRKEITGFFPEVKSKISVTYNGISSELLKQNAHNTKEKILLTIGSFHARKNLHNLIDLFLKSSLSSDYKLYIVGSKSAFFSKINMDFQNNSIELFSEISDQELAILYQKSEFYIAPSMYEGFGIPVLEAIYFDCKLICNKLDVYKELYNQEILSVDFSKSSEVSSVFENLNKIQQLNIESKNHFLRNYSYNKSANEILLKFQSEYNQSIHHKSNQNE